MGRIEQMWVRGLDSAAWRQWAGSAPLRAVRSSAPFQSSDMARRYVLSRYHASRERERYRSVRSLCLMIGHMKSGGTLLGSLLDAHPHAAFADEIDALRYFSGGFAPQQVFFLLEKGARRETMKGRVTARRLEAYSFSVPGQSQGEADRLEVVGESKAGITTQRLGADPGLLPRVEAMLAPATLQLVQVVRNPFEPMSVMMIRGGRSFEEAKHRYFENCEILMQLHASLPPSSLHVVHYEDMVRDPATELGRVCDYLGLDAPPDYLSACAAIVEPQTPERTRVSWERHQIDLVTREMSRFPFLAAYSFDDEGCPR